MARKTSPIGRLILVGALGIGAMMALKGWDSREALVAKANVQKGHTERLQRWKAAYEALLPIEGRWQATYGSTSEIQDLLGLYERVDIGKSGVNVSPETLVLQSADRVRLRNQDIGLNRICLSSAGQKGLVMTASTFGELLNGIESLANRPDIEIGEVVIGLGADKTPRIVAQDFCALLRDPTADEKKEKGGS